MIEKYGKSFNDILSLKQSFFDDNDRHLRRSLDFADFYNLQPVRANCKICNEPLSSATVSFKKHNILYRECIKCGQLNGYHDDSDEFCAAVYTSNGGSDYSKFYSAQGKAQYELRTQSIYTPKAKFLIDSLSSLGENVNNYTFADMGAGSGYFLNALNHLDLTSVFGFEVGDAQVQLGCHMLGTDQLKLIKLHETIDIVSTFNADVMTFIGVFEHLQNPRGILAALKNNKYVKYMYFCVPLFSPTVFNEAVFPSVMPRHLSVGHTHLFTDQSISYFCHEFGFKQVAAWWFGTDVMDYFRSVYVQLSSNNEQSKICDKWVSMYTDIIDDMQLAIDKKKKSSQVHMLLKLR